MSLNNILNSVRNYLGSQYMYADEEWLSGFVEFLSAENSNNYNESDIRNLAKEQWLLNDLKEICPGSLPANLMDQHKTILNGKFVLQINASVDIGTPAYQQYLKLQKINMENIEATTKFEDKVPNHRMIKLYLTDGVQDVSAIEYRPMRNLSCDITPGCKVLIKGPIECRRGILLLTENSIELLGGEVEEMATSNSLAGLLSSKLGVSITQDQNTTFSHSRNVDIPMPHTEVLSGRPQSMNHDFEPKSETHFADDDIDIDQLNAIETQLIENTSKRPLVDNHSKPEKKIKIEPAININKPDSYPDDDLIFNEDEDYLREMEEKFSVMENSLTDNDNKGSIAVSPEPFVYIKQINDMRKCDRAGRVFKVKGQIMKLLSKLSVGKEGWNLKCTLVDGTGSIDADFSSDVLSKLVGFTPQEMNKLKKEMASKPELKERAAAALQKAKDTLQVLCCLIDLTMLEVPKITGLTPFEHYHVDQLQKRIQASGL